MTEPLYKFLGKKSDKVEVINSAILTYESGAKKDWWISPVSLVSEDYEIGIEIEVENVKQSGCTEYSVWAQHADGSLRNNGLEYVTTPIKGKRIPFALNQFFATMGKDIHFSPRTSIHIHLNVLNMTPKQIAGLLMTYLPMEKLLYRFVGGDRDKNNFCVPLSDASVNKVLSYFLADKFYPPQLQNNRYLGLNIDSVRKFGTLEFRHLGGTNDVAKIIKWINLIFCLKKYAVSHSWENIKATISKLNSDSQYTVFFNDVFPYPTNTYLTSFSLQKDMELAVSQLKKLTLDNSFKLELQKTSKKNSLWVVRWLKKEPPTSFVIGSGPVLRRNRRNAPIDDAMIMVRHAAGQVAAAQRLNAIPQIGRWNENPFEGAPFDPEPAIPEMFSDDEDE